MIIAASSSAILRGARGTANSCTIHHARPCGSAADLREIERSVHSPCAGNIRIRNDSVIQSDRANSCLKQQCLPLFLPACPMTTCSAQLPVSTAPR